MDFLSEMKMLAKGDKKKIVLPESYEPRILKAADVILKEDIADLILIGNEEKIKAVDPSLQLDKAIFIDPEKYNEYDSLVEEFYNMRKDKGLTMVRAVKNMEDPLYLGVMLVKKGIADGMVAGSVNATANVLRPALQILKTDPNTKLVSAFFVLVVPNKAYGEEGVFVFGDCGLNQNPKAHELAEIAKSCASTFKALVKAEPRVAMLSHSTKGSASHPDVEKVVEATRLAQYDNPDLLIDGELQLDAALVPEIGQQKAPGSEVAGKANVLVFPTLDAGNIGYKLVQRLAGADAYGPITQGIAKPVNDLSRGCSPEDVIGVIAITAVQAQLTANK